MANVAVSGPPTDEAELFGTGGTVRASWGEDGDTCFVTLEIPRAVLEELPKHEEVLIGLALSDYGLTVHYCDDGAVSDETFERFRLDLLEGGR